MARSYHCIAFAALVVLVACGAPAPVAPSLPTVQPARLTPVRVSAHPLAAQAACTDGFVAHTLDFTTTIRDSAVHLFDSNGAGVAVGDLDDDGRDDLVFANLDGPNTIFWNRGGLRFAKQELDDSNARAVALVDSEGDGRLDIVFSYRGGSVGRWRNLGAAQFVRQPLPGVLAPAYGLAWGDLNGDGALDLVTGSYDSELAKRQTNAFLFSQGGGVYLYTQHSDGSFAAERLAREAQALAIALPDLDGDGRADILVGNDFLMRDGAWLHSEGGWTPASPFATTAESSMSLDVGDIDNDGQFEIFATDMKPYDSAISTLAAWLPLMATMPQKRDRDDPQRVENVLQVRDANGSYQNEAYSRRVDATGWSWSGKFGDLDNDGWLDLYVVNGMIAAELFGHLPANELIEQNQALQNDGSGHFRPVPAWGLGATGSGRGMSMADLDGDGDLDIVVNNLGSSAQLFENRLCGGAGLEVALRWPDSRNTRAIGALLALHTSAGTFYRDVRALSGYLSGDSPQVHFGLPIGATVEQLEIRWPDGARSRVAPLSAQTALTVTR